MKFYLCCTNEYAFIDGQLIYCSDELAKILHQAGYQLHRSDYEDSCRWWFEIDSVVLLLAICRIIGEECIINTWRDRNCD